LYTADQAAATSAMMWSNKALLAILWELNPGHELLLPTYLDGPHKLTSNVRKPFFGREGAGIAVVQDGVAVEGVLTAENAPGCVCLAIASMATGGGKTAVFGSWLVDGEPADMGVRESKGRVEILHIRHGRRRKFPAFGLD
jgi:glutathionylspermidine synthase